MAFLQGREEGVLVTGALSDRRFDVAASQRVRGHLALLSSAYRMEVFEAKARLIID